MDERWNRALKELRTQMSSENFDTWLAPVQCDELSKGHVSLRIPNRFFQDWISAHYLDLIVDSLNRECDQAISRVDWHIDESLQQHVARRANETVTLKPPAPLTRTSATGRSGKPAGSSAAGGDLNAGINRQGEKQDLNPKYSFDDFVVGPSNQLAHAASVAAASEPGNRYNPLFIYGGVGLGKTHLVNAIGHRIVNEDPEAKILYLSAEHFTNEFIWSLQNHKINLFRKRYREQCDVLLMDDIQFLAGREQTQEEFFHTFNALYHSDKQIVVTSDVYPQQIPEMEERLISRFQSGMVADIQAPELDTRIAILLRKANQEDIPLSSEVAHFVAQHVTSNVRELEGTLLRLAVRAELMNRTIDLTFASETLDAARVTADQITTVEDIQKAVCDFFSIRLADLKSRRRHRTVSFPRMVAMYMSRKKLGTSYPELGQRFGGKDHTTVINAVRKIDGLLELRDQQTSSAIVAIERKLGIG